MRPRKQRAEKRAHKRSRASFARLLLVLGVTSAIGSTMAMPATPAPAAAPEAAPAAVISVGADPRFKPVVYNENSVVTITAHYGYHTDITFAPDEVVLDRGVALGDSNAWEVGPAANHLFVKPKAEEGQTGMTVITSRGRTYTFLLQVAPKRPTKAKVNTDLFMRVIFKYPADEAAALAAKKKSDAEVAADNLANAKREVRNIEYMACGDDDVNPDTVFDDGRFTYMRYVGNRELPSIFVSNDDGSESLVNSHVAPNEPETVIVQRIAKRFIFRRGKTVGCIVNKGFDPRGTGTLSGTIDPGVVRIIKGPGA